MPADILEKNLKIVFCGTGEGHRSMESGLYYDSPGNKFWMILYKTGLTPVCLKPKECSSITSYGIGLTDLGQNPPEGDKNKYDFQREALTQKILSFSPKIICFNGKKAAKAYFKKRDIDYGWQNQNIGRTKVYVAPSTSGSAGRYWDEKWWYLLADSLGVNVTKVDRTNYYQPDKMTHLTAPVKNITGDKDNITEEVFLKAVEDIELHYSIPLHIKNMFEIAKALFVYGYLYFPFCTLAIEQALKSLEATVTLKYDELEGPKVNDKGLYPGFADKINYLYSRRWITKVQKGILHDCRQLRNMSFHPKYQQVLSHYDGALRTLAMLMNEIWVGDTRY